MGKPARSGLPNLGVGCGLELGTVFRGGRGPEVAENTVRAIEAPEGRHSRRDEKKIRVSGDGYGTGVLSEAFANRNKKGPTFR